MTSRTPRVRSDAFAVIPSRQLVFAFDEPCEGGRELLGGKGVGLAEMTQLGVPVPAGFTITTDACRAYMREGGLPAGLDEEIGEHIVRLEQKAGKRTPSRVRRVGRLATECSAKLVHRRTCAVHERASVTNPVIEHKDTCVMSYHDVQFADRYVVPRPLCPKSGSPSCFLIPGLMPALLRRVVV
jgi:phosphoenolpyruvate synthase/pyruvate phosphate dikinase